VGCYVMPLRGCKPSAPNQMAGVMIKAEHTHPRPLPRGERGGRAMSLKAKKIIIATGATENALPFPG
jgi:pyruvate/2-oxoglutarate dehydrogenase complex dihydrolipoamide dehydrogenase (E3) component